MQLNRSRRSNEELIQEYADQQQIEYESQILARKLVRQEEDPFKKFAGKVCGVRTIYGGHTLPVFGKVSVSDNHLTIKKRNGVLILVAKSNIREIFVVKERNLPNAINVSLIERAPAPLF